MTELNRNDAEQAVRKLLEWIGDDPNREGLLDTPKRVVKAFEEYFAGYEDNPEAVLGRTFEEVGGYDDIVILRGIEINSHCEHHIAPIIGRAHVAYMPVNRVVGISKLARIVEIYSRRLQTQETLTAQIAETIEKALQPAGVAVVIEAQHHCMRSRGVKKPGVDCVTQTLTGVFKTDERLERRFRSLTAHV